jgi:hypothetical protein
MFLLAVNFPAMADLDDEDDDALVLDAANDPIVADPIAPISRLRPLERMADGSRIIEHGDMPLQVIANSIGGLMIQLS